MFKKNIQKLVTFRLKTADLERSPDGCREYNIMLKYIILRETKNNARLRDEGIS